MEENKVAGLPDMIGITEMISINVICRLCANQNDKLIGIYSEDGINNDLANKMNLYLPIKVNDMDDLPLQCCWQCASTLLAWHDLVITSVEADRRLRSYQFVTEKQLEEVRIKFNTQDENQENKSEEFLNDSDSMFNETISCDNLINKNESSNDFFELSNVKIKSTSKTPIENPTKINIEDSQEEMINKQPKIKESTTDPKLPAKILQRKNPKHRRKKTEVNPSFMCCFCTKAFCRKFDMQRHIANKHPEKQANFEKSKRSQNLLILKKCQTNSTEYECDFCAQKFDKPEKLHQHRKSHDKEKQQCCHVCGKKFIRSTNLHRHIEQVHEGVKKYRCDVCDRKFASKTTRDEHLNIHTNNRPFVCDICGKTFKQNSSLYVHQLFHSTVLRFSCSICNKKFRRRQDLKVHNWMHTGEKPKECGVCKKTFRLGHELKRHMKTHAEFICSTCGLKFHQEKFLHMHRKIH